MPLINEYFPFPDEKNPADKIQLVTISSVLDMLILQYFPERIFSRKEICASSIAG